MNANAQLAPLAPLRAHAGARRTQGLDEATLQHFALTHPELAEAIAAAAAEYEHIRAEFPELLDLDEDAQIRAVEAGFVNFYAMDAVIRSSRSPRAARGSSPSRARCSTTRRLRDARPRPHA